MKPRLGRPRAGRGAGRARRRHRVRRAGESYLAVLDGFHEHAERIRFVACRHEGGAAFMAEAQGKLSGPAGHLLRHARPRRDQRQHRRAHRVPGLDADGPVHRPGGERPARPRGVPGGRLPADVRPRHARHGQVGRARWTPPTALPEYVARAFHTALQGRPGPVVLALPEDMLDARRPPRRCCRASSRSQAWPAPAALRRAARSCCWRPRRPLVIAGGGGWDAERCARAAALRRELAAAGGLRLPLPGHCSTTAIRSTPATSASASIRQARRAHPRGRPGRSRSARGSAR